MMLGVITYHDEEARTQCHDLVRYVVFFGCDRGGRTEDAAGECAAKGHAGIEACDDVLF